MGCLASPEPHNIKYEKRSLQRALTKLKTSAFKGSFQVKIFNFACIAKPEGKKIKFPKGKADKKSMCLAKIKIKRKNSL